MSSLEDEFGWTPAMAFHMAKTGTEITAVYRKKWSQREAFAEILKLDLTPEERLVIAFGLGVWAASFGPYRKFGDSVKDLYG